MLKQRTSGFLVEKGYLVLGVVVNLPPPPPLKFQRIFMKSSRIQKYSGREANVLNKEINRNKTADEAAGGANQ
ncbi:MAG: hypothetical protein HZA00_10850 [Nitrospinae bacterium]|nr:hypothetical protein [Nitrospinota bacterium]